MSRRVLIVFGTRPEAIKMAPLVLEMRRSHDLAPVVCVTAQHREMLDQVLALFEITPDYDLDLMRPGQSLTEITTRALTGLAPILHDVKPAMIFVHGDTTTAMAAALAGFYASVPIGHVEAGLRSHDMRQPWPEEMNRSVIDLLSSMMFAPTRSAERNLLREGRDGAKIFVTGNTGIDSLFATLSRIKERPALEASLQQRFDFLGTTRRLIVVTAHRRESFGDGFERICTALSRVADRDDVEIVYPVHPNPNVQGPVNRFLRNHPRIHLISPTEYVEFVYLMSRSFILLTDSGGIQEEGPALGRPVLVMRDVTERPEAVEAGTVKLVGTDVELITSSVQELLDNEETYKRFSRAQSPYGDGTAAVQIVQKVRDAYSLQ